MLIQTLRFRLAVVLVFGLFLFCSGAFAQEDGKRGDLRANNQGDLQADSQADSQVTSQTDSRKQIHGYRYYYRDGRWYTRGWFGLEFPVSALTIGALVESLPPNHTVMVVGDIIYYYDNTLYYRQLPDGVYVVAPAPQ